MPQEIKSPRRSKRGASGNLQTGTFIFPNGEKYAGEFANHGQGRIERSGFGTHTFNNGLVYSGCWVKDKMSGQGELKYPSGASYKGEFSNNEYCGSGTYTWPDGASFTGTFSDNRIDGEGEYTDSKGHVWMGTVSGKVALGLRLKLS